jgi:hypothetical protein
LKEFLETGERGDCPGGQRFGELARIALQTLGELQRDRAGEVPVLGLARLRCDKRRRAAVSGQKSLKSQEFY